MKGWVFHCCRASWTLKVASVVSSPTISPKQTLSSPIG